MGEQSVANNLHAKLETVHDEDSFVAFVAALAADRADEVQKEKEQASSPYGAGANGWEHGTIEGYLDAASAFATDWKKNPVGLPKTDNPWRRCARILLGGKHYE
jgi:hypothetical protein